MFRTVALMLALLAYAPSAYAVCEPVPELAAYETFSAEDYASGQTSEDRVGRVVAPVFVNGRGPFRFVVDTGANRSVLTPWLVAELGLSPHAMAEVNTVHGVISAPLTHIQSLDYGGVTLNATDLPVLEGPMLAGASGLLGVDGMAGRRLRIDFDRDCVEISPATRRLVSQNWITVRGTMRFGHLVVFPGRVRDIDVNLILDTGSDSTFANEALRVALASRLRQTEAIAVALSAGEPIVLSNFIHIQRMDVGPMEVRQVNAFVGDFHVFDIWGLVDQPALLIGMDVLAQTRAIAIDYQRGLIHFRLHRTNGVAVRRAYESRVREP
jgi:predicted aspartyl protease